MGRNSKIVIAAILTLATLAIASCSSQSEQSSHPSPTYTPAARAPFKNPGVSNEKVTNQPFKNPEVLTKQTPPVTSTTTANLIQPMDSTKRVSIVSKGRNDPFARIVVPDSIKVTNQPAQAKPVPKLPPISTPKSKPHSVITAISKNPLNQQKLNQEKHTINKKAIARVMPGGLFSKQPSPCASSTGQAAEACLRHRAREAIALGGSNSLAQSAAPKKVINHNSAPPVARVSHNKIKPNGALTRVLPKVLPQAIPNSALASVTPPQAIPNSALSVTPPQPELAKAVVVSGVVLIGKEPQAIIKVPNEPTSQYVHAGQQLANGVLIKRIEINEGSEPVVILEQYGIEVAKMVGQGLTTQTSPTASGENPVSNTALPQNPVPEEDT
ncbi:hypothetical protein [Brasilonema octagenarum]|uniref:hypothetical protein n=1 Tax=Brasilonema octagenarum TaxID=417105 RepID=UPI002006EEBA|nr:hypothetical protein [Brasilonema octagenarum]